MKLFHAALVLLGLSGAGMTHAGEGETPVDVDACELMSNPMAYHRQLVRVTARVSRGKTVPATLVGHVFAKEAYQTGGDEDAFGGFGHFGMFSLLVIERVEKTR